MQLALVVQVLDVSDIAWPLPPRDSLFFHFFSAGMQLAVAVQVLDVCDTGIYEGSKKYNGVNNYSIKDLLRLSQECV